VKILLAIPTAGQPTQPFLASLAELQLPAQTTGFDQLTVRGNFVPGQRELAVRRAIALGADVLAMIDDDMIFPPDALSMLVAALDADPGLALVGALYYGRDGMRPMAASRWHSKRTTTATVPAFTDDLVDVDAIGFGCIALRVDALRGLVPPYFSTQIYIEEHAARVRICNEDFLFCERLREIGLRTALHAGVRCKHFDRASGIAHPQVWEPADATRVERMLVRDAGPSLRLIPYDDGAATTHELHEVAQLDYIFVD
jgi:GT2 family glycosyltransferase